MKIDEMTIAQFKDYVTSLNDCEYLMGDEEVTYKNETKTIKEWVNEFLRMDLSLHNHFSFKTEKE